MHRSGEGTELEEGGGTRRCPTPGVRRSSPSLETANTERCCPENLSLALDALEADEALYEAVGREIVDHFVVMKRAEWARYARAVTDWELREYLAFH